MSDSDWDDAVTDLAQWLMNAPDESSEQNHPCPDCGSRLIIHMGRYQRYTNKMLGITIECRACNKALAIDSLDM